jgi:hypothetical protein
MYNLIMMKRKELCMPEKQFNKIQEESEETGLSMSDIIRRAIDFYFLHHKEQKHESRRTENNNPKRS